MSADVEDQIPKAPARPCATCWLGDVGDGPPCPQCDKDGAMGRLVGRLVGRPEGAAMSVTRTVPGSHFLLRAATCHPSWLPGDCPVEDRHE
jgi:hypothetical protein